jgi:hypothetical protein
MGSDNRVGFGKIEGVGGIAHRVAWTAKTNEPCFLESWPNYGNPKIYMGTVNGGPLELNRDEVGALIAHLSAWLKNGSLEVIIWPSIAMEIADAEPTAVEIQPATFVVCNPSSSAHPGWALNEERKYEC